MWCLDARNATMCSLTIQPQEDTRGHARSKKQKQLSSEQFDNVIMRILYYFLQYFFKSIEYLFNYKNTYILIIRKSYTSEINQMGGNQSQISNIGTAKGEGYRIIHVKTNSPLDGQVDVFFDFIIDAIPLKQPDRTPKDILGKLTQGQQKKSLKSVKKLQQLLSQNQNTAVQLKIVSTKYRNVKVVQITPNKNWNGHDDAIGFQTRKQRYDQAFQTYFPFADIRQGSPVKKSGIQQGEFLIGCKQFKFISINQLIENLYDRYFDKSVQNKNVHFAVYNILNDQLRLVPVLLARGWGEKGLLGCQFLEGHLNRFPKNLLQKRDELVLRKKKSDDMVKIKKQLSESNGASVQLIQSLRNQKNRKKRNVRNLKNLLLIQPVKNQSQMKQQDQKQYPSHVEQQKKQQNKSSIQGPYVSFKKFRQLENRVATLQQMLSNVKQYIQDMGDSDQQAEKV